MRYFYGTNGLPELPVANPLVTDLQTSNPDNQAYFMDMPVQAQWPIYYDLDSTADNSFDALPPVVKGAKWIALRRVTKAGQETDLTFKLARPATIFVMTTWRAEPPSYLSDAGFKEVASPDLVWRDNRLMLVPAQLFSRLAAAGGKNIFCARLFEQICPGVGIPIRGGEHRKKILVAEFRRRAKMLRVPVHHALVAAIHITHIPFAAVRRDRINTPMHHDAEFCVAEPVGVLVICADGIPAFLKRPGGNRGNFF